MKKVVVADTGPLIGLGYAGYLNILQQLYGEVLIPEQVQNELQLSSHRPGAANVAEAITTGLIKVHKLRQPPEFLLQDMIDAGEAAAIQLAIEQQADILVIDDKKGRRVAKMKNLRIVGTGGLLLASKKAGYVEEVEPILEKLVVGGYRLSDALCQQILKLAGED